MKIRSKLLTLTLFIHSLTTAQSSLRNKRTFERSLATIVASAADDFEAIKGKQKKNRSSRFSGKQYEISLLLPGVDDVFVSVNKNESFCYAEVGRFVDFNEAFELYVQLIRQTDEALRRRTYSCSDSTDKFPGSKLTRAGIKTMSGFFEPNILIGIEAAEKYILYMQVTGGLPNMYSMIPRGQGGQSLLFRYQFNKLKDRFEQNEVNVCGDLPGYRCEIQEAVCKTAVYTKTSEDEPNAKYEFSNLFTEVKAALKEDFVYIHNASSKSVLYETMFIRKTDICKADRRTITVRLVKISNKRYDVQVELRSLPVTVVVPIP